jgi:hypothetical protein
MISTRSGVASLSQTQIMLWTFLIGASAVYVMALSGVLIDITDTTLVLLGITGVATIGSKLQSSQQSAKGETQADGKSVVPGGVLGLVQVGTATESEVRLAWAPPTSGGSVRYFIVQYQQTPPAGTTNSVWSAVGETIVLPHCTVLGLAPATSYQFRVIAGNASGQGEPELIGPISTLAQAGNPTPGRPSGLRIAEAPTLNSVSLEWSPASGDPTGYKVEYRRHDSVEAWTVLSKQPQETECIVPDLTSGVAYDFRVTALEAKQQGIPSAVVTARTLRNPEWADLVVTGDGRGEIDVTRAQMLFFTLVAALFVGMKVLTSYVIPDIPSGILLLIGISNGVYITAKFIPDK